MYHFDLTFVTTRFLLHFTPQGYFVSLFIQISVCLVINTIFWFLSPDLVERRTVVAKVGKREGDFQDGNYFSRLPLKGERINQQEFRKVINLTLSPTLSLTPRRTLTLTLN